MQLELLIELSKLATEILGSTSEKLLGDQTQVISSFSNTWAM